MADDIETKIRITADDEQALRSLDNFSRKFANHYKAMGEGTQKFNSDLGRTRDKMQDIYRGAEQYLGRGVVNETEKATSAIGRMRDGLVHAGTAAGNYGVAFGKAVAGAAAAAAVQQSLANLAETERAMTRTRMAMNLTGDESEKLGKRMRSMSGETGESVEHLQTQFRLFSAQSGLPFKEAVDQFEFVARGAKAMGISVADASSLAGQTTKQMGVNTKELQEIWAAWTSELKDAPELAEQFARTAPASMERLRAANMANKQSAIELAAVYKNMARETPEGMQKVETGVVSLLSRLEQYNKAGIMMLPTTQKVKEQGGSLLQVLDSFVQEVGKLGGSDMAKMKMLGLDPKDMDFIRAYRAQQQNIRGDVKKSADDIGSVNKANAEIDKTLTAQARALRASITEVSESIGALTSSIGRLAFGGGEPLRKLANDIKAIGEVADTMRKYLDGEKIDWEKFLNGTGLRKDLDRLKLEAGVYLEAIKDIFKGHIFSDSPELKEAEKRLREFDQKTAPRSDFDSRFGDWEKKKSKQEVEDDFERRQQQEIERRSGTPQRFGDFAPGPYSPKTGGLDNFLSDSPMSTNIEDRRQQDETNDNLGKLTAAVVHLTDILEDRTGGGTAQRFTGGGAGAAAAGAGGVGGSGGSGGPGGAGNPMGGLPGAPGLGGYAGSFKNRFTPRGTMPDRGGGGSGPDGGSGGRAGSGGAPQEQLFNPISSDQFLGGVGENSASRGKGGHQGEDWGAPIGSPVYAVKDGTIERISTDNFGTPVATIRHDDGTYTRDMHLKPGSIMGKVGDRVKGGEQYASSGIANGTPHLHHERWTGDPKSRGSKLLSPSQEAGRSTRRGARMEGGKPSPSMEAYNRGERGGAGSQQSNQSPGSGDWQTGKGSWYSQFDGNDRWRDRGDKPGSSALGVPDDQQGISLPSGKGLGQWYDVTAPNGETYRLQQTDKGPHPRTGRSIDISARAADGMGYTSKNFPTDGKFSYRPASPPEGLENMKPREQAAAYARQQRGGIARVGRGDDAPARPRGAVDHTEGARKFGADHSDDGSASAIGAWKNARKEMEKPIRPQIEAPRIPQMAPARRNWSRHSARLEGQDSTRNARHNAAADIGFA